MKIAVIGSRSLALHDIKRYFPQDTTEIISGGARGADRYAKKYAEENGIPYIEFLPNYNIYRRSAPLKRNEEIILSADMTLAFWDGKSRGTLYGMNFCLKVGKKLKVFLFRNPR